MQLDGWTALHHEVVPHLPAAEPAHRIRCAAVRCDMPAAFADAPDPGAAADWFETKVSKAAITGSPLEDQKVVKDAEPQMARGWNGAEAVEGALWSRSDRDPLQTVCVDWVRRTH